MKKIAHICISGTISDGFTYQDNLLSKYHVRCGYDVSIITHCYTRNTDKNSTGTYKKLNAGREINSDGVQIIRLELSAGKDNNAKLKRVDGFYETLEEIQPDIIFTHGCQFVDAFEVARYVKNHRTVKLYVDNHADFSNSATNVMSRYMLHRILWRRCAHALLPYTEKFYGVLPARVDFLVSEYGIPKEKVELLVMGADDDNVAKAKTDNQRMKVRTRYGIDDTSLLIVTGGVIDPHKSQTIALMEAVHHFKEQNVHLIVFGKVSDELKERVESLNNYNVHYIGWINSSDSYSYFEAADVAIFPGRHSVFWEQVVGQGKPIVVKDWPGTHHVDLGGNAFFLEDGSVEEISSLIETLIKDPTVLKKMKDTAEKKGMEEFSYLKIAARSIGEGEKNV